MLLNHGHRAHLILILIQTQILELELLLNLILSAYVPLDNAVGDRFLLLLKSLTIHSHSEFLRELVEILLCLGTLVVEIFHLNHKLEWQPVCIVGCENRFVDKRWPLNFISYHRRRLEK